MLTVIATITFLILARAFRSVVLAAKVVLVNLVSLGATFGFLTGQELVPVECGSLAIAAPFGVLGVVCLSCSAPISPYRLGCAYDERR